MSQEVVLAEVSIGPGTSVGLFNVLGYPKEARIRADIDKASKPVEIGADCLIFNHVVVYEGVHIGEGCLLEDRTRIGYDSRVGRNSRLIYGAYVCDRVEIGEQAHVAGFVCDGTKIGNRSTVMGQLVHEYTQPHAGWWEVDEQPPVIHHDVVVAYGAQIVGGVVIGPHSYVAAGAVVTKDVPSRTVVTGTNLHTPASDWRGKRLQSLITHWQGPCVEC